MTDAICPRSWLVMGAALDQPCPHPTSIGSPVIPVNSHAMRIVHISDLHLTSLAERSAATLWGKRWTGYGSWMRRRRWEHRREVLDRLLAAIYDERPDQILITGDLTHIGLPEEIRAVRAWLRDLGPAVQVFLVPGNHDVYARDSWPVIRREWADYLHLDRSADNSRMGDVYPIVRELGGVALVALNSALSTPILMASGLLGKGQLARLDLVLEQLHARGVPCCLMLHHSPLRGVSSWRKALRDAHELERLLIRHAPAVLLHGHLHRNQDMLFGATRVLATAPASSAMLDQPASYRILDFSPEAQGWRIAMTLKQADQAGGSPLTVGTDCWLHRLQPG